MARSMAESGSSRRRAWEASRLRTKLINRAFWTCCVSQSSASATVSIPTQVSGWRWRLGQSVPRWRSKSRCIWGATQLCT